MLVRFPQMQAEAPGSQDRIVTDLIRRLQRIPVFRSLAELTVSREEYGDLLTWVSGLSGHRARQDLFWGLGRHQLGEETWTRNELLGIGFFMVIAETARRRASEGSPWPTVQEDLRGCRDQLFAGSGQPAQLLKDGLEAAARKGRLRHVFGATGT